MKNSSQRINRIKIFERSTESNDYRWIENRRKHSTNDLPLYVGSPLLINVIAMPQV